MRLTQLALLAPLALILACAAPSQRLASERLVVLGSDAEQVWWVYGFTWERMPQVQERMESGRSDRLTLTIEDEPGHLDGVSAWTEDTGIRLFPSAMTRPDKSVLHELVHWYAVDSPYAALPQAVEEGLADYLAYELTDEEVIAARLRMLDELDSFTLPGEVLDSDAAAFLELPMEQNIALRHIGFLICHRLGLDGLRELAARGASTIEYLDAAGIPWDRAED